MKIIHIISLIFILISCQTPKEIEVKTLSFDDMKKYEFVASQIIFESSLENDNPDKSNYLTYSLIRKLKNWQHSNFIASGNENILKINLKSAYIKNIKNDKDTSYDIYEANLGVNFELFNDQDRLLPKSESYLNIKNDKFIDHKLSLTERNIMLENFIVEIIEQFDEEARKNIVENFSNYLM